MSGWMRAAILAATAVAVAGVPAGAQQRDRARANCDPDWHDNCPREARAKIDTTIAFERRGVIELSSHSGDILVTGWSRAEVKIEATSEYGDLTFSPGASRLTLSVRQRRGRIGETRFVLSVPTGTRVVARTQSGDVTISGVKGEVDVSAMSGDVEVTDAADRIEIGTASGDIMLRGATGTTRIHALSAEVDVRDVSGDLEVETVSGEILMTGITSRFVRGESTSGDVEYQGAIEPGGRYELRSHSGDLRVDLPGDVSAWVDVETFTGEIESDFPITLQPSDRLSGSRQQRFDFKIGDGKARVSLESFSGEIRIVRRGER